MPDTKQRHKVLRKRAVSESSPDEDIGSRTRRMQAAQGAERDELRQQLGDEYLYAAERGNDRSLRVFVEAGFPVMWQDPKNGLTALHVVAACRARKALRVLLATDQCDFLLRDNHGRLPSEMAYLHGRDAAISRLLGNKERKQAKAQGIKLTRRPSPD